MAQRSRDKAMMNGTRNYQTTTKIVEETTSHTYANHTNSQPSGAYTSSLARVEDLERALPKMMSVSVRSNNQSSVGKRSDLYNHRCPYLDEQGAWNQVSFYRLPENETIPGNDRATTISTIACKTGKSRIVIALLKERQEFQLKIQEMLPGLFDLGRNLKECLAVRDEHLRAITNLKAQNQTPVENLMVQYEKIMKSQPNATQDNKTVYGCMAENLECCWQALLNQLNHRARLLDDAVEFYSAADELSRMLAEGEREFNSKTPAIVRQSDVDLIKEKIQRLDQINQTVLDLYNRAVNRKQKLLNSIQDVRRNNFGDSRHDYLNQPARETQHYIESYLDSLVLRYKKYTINFQTIRQTLSQEISNISSKITKTTSITNSYSEQTNKHDITKRSDEHNSLLIHRRHMAEIRNVKSLEDLNQLESWLKVKIDQLNTHQLASLGLSITDSKTILGKHDQIQLECREIENSAQNLKLSVLPQYLNDTSNERDGVTLDPNDRKQIEESLLAQQKAFLNRTKNALTILEARVYLLRKTIDFYTQAKDAVSDIQTLLTRLEIDHSLQSVNYIQNELDMKDIPSIIASGATILSELHQAQLRHQQQIEVNLNLENKGIRATIDHLNQSLMNLRSLMAQRKHHLLNEDTGKIANNFLSQCDQLHKWLNDHVRRYLLDHRSMGMTATQIKQFYDGHQDLQNSMQNKTLDVEALLRSLPTLVAQLDADSPVSGNIQSATDELRQDWINLTNALDKRLELAKKYLNVLQFINRMSNDMNELEKRSANSSKQPDDIIEGLNQNSLQLDNIVKNFIFDCKKASDPKDTQNNLNFNTKESVDYIKEFVDNFNDRKAALIQSYDRVKTDQSKPEENLPLPTVNPPTFIKVLRDLIVRPSTTVELECQTDSLYPVEWSMNDNKPIPLSIDHKIVSQGTKHKLVISNFNENCCGTYLAKVSNEAGQTITSAKLSLPQETNMRNATVKQQWTQRDTRINQNVQHLTVADNNVPRAWSPASSTSSFSRWRPVKAPAVKQGPRVHGGHNPVDICISSASNDVTDRPKLVIMVNSVGSVCSLSRNSSRESPCRPATRSPSKSPFEGPSQAPVFVEELRNILPRDAQSAELACSVIANPAPTIDWYHNGVRIACTKKLQLSNFKGGICKLTIDSVGPQTIGHYKCEASNRFGSSSTDFQLKR